MSRYTIPRRTILRGAGGAALALPALNVMRQAKALAASGQPKRFVFCYADVSTGGCYRIQQTPPSLIAPNAAGAGYDKTPGLRTVFENGVQAEMGIVSGLTIPWKGQEEFAADPTRPPPVGKGPFAYGFHGRSLPVQFGGTSVFTEYEDGGAPRAASADQLAASVISGTTPIRSLQLHVTPVTVFPISYEAPDEKSRKDKWGRPIARAIEPIVSPTVAYKKLFGAPIPGGGPPISAAAALQVRRSIIDTVGQATKMLVARLGQEDRVQMERYLDQIRTLEERIKKIDPNSVAACQKPTAITSDPRPPQAYDHNTDNTEIYDVNAGWSDETLRGNIQGDMIHAAFSCDLTRVVSWGLSTGLMNLYPVNGQKMDFHGATHAGGGLPPTIADAQNWALGHVARLVSLLKDTRDFDGRRMIDNTVILVCFEGGWGRHAEATAPTSFRDNPASDPDYAAGLRYAHSLENMLVVMAGGKNLGLQAGQHIRYKNDRHPSQVMLTALRQLGYQGNFGEVSEPLPEMLTLG